MEEAFDGLKEKDEFQQLSERLDRIESLLLSKKDVLTLNECAAYMGYTKNHIYRLTSQRAIPFYKPMGGKIVFRKSEIDEWLLRNRQATAEEIDSRATTAVVLRRMKHHY